MSKLSKIILTALGIIILAFFLFVILIFSISPKDCAWFASAVAWVDVNDNGTLDQGETSLEGVAVHVDDIRNSYFDVAYPVTTDENGEAQLDVWLPGCPDVSFEVYADIPEGYRPTTKTRLVVSKNFWGASDTETTYYFGFTPDE